jgi:hypothetical protein
MAQDSQAASGEPAGEDAAAGLSAIERVQRELADTRTTLQGEASQISQLQEALETALHVARGVRLEALNQLDRLAGELMDAARRDAAAIRVDAEAEAEKIRAAAQAEAQALREAAEADAAEDRAEIARRLRTAQSELDQIETALTTAVQVLTRARDGLLAGTDDVITSAAAETPPRPPAVSPPSPPASPPSPPVSPLSPPASAAQPASPAASPAAELPYAPRSEPELPYAPRSEPELPYAPRSEPDLPYAPRSEPELPYAPRSEAPPVAPHGEPAPAPFSLTPDEEAPSAAAPPTDKGSTTGGPQSPWAAAPPEPAQAERPKEENTQEFPLGAVSRAPTPESEPSHPAEESPTSAAESLAADEEPTPLHAEPRPTSPAHAELEEPTPLHAELEEPRPAHAEPATAADGGLLDDANRQLDAGDVPGALDAMRAIVDRQPEHVEPVIARLTGLLQDSRYRAHYEEVRLLLVDAYMVQGDYDRAMSLLHEPS